MHDQLFAINAHAHTRTFHPGALPWPASIDDDEGRFCSRFVFGTDDRASDALLYIAKELAQLSEIEKHVSTTMGLLMGELGGEPHPLAAGFALHNALSCFAAEELQHADMFYRYVRLLLGRDLKLDDSLMAERLALYQGEDPVLVKLAALVASAYVGESVMTVFEHRIDTMDPEGRYFVTKVVKAHGLDEARHIQFDHFVFQHVVPGLSTPERARFASILSRQLAFNHQLGGAFQTLAIGASGRDYTVGNLAHEAQQRLLDVFAKLVFAGGGVREIDDVLDGEASAVVREFAGVVRIHPQVAS